jgi:hypothetical protein
MDTDTAVVIDPIASEVPLAKPKKWALVDAGFVVQVRSSYDYIAHPFGDDANDKVVLDVSGTACAPGWVADHKGNVAPAVGITSPLLSHEPAYHDRSNPPALPTGAVAATLMGNEPHPLVKAGAVQPDGEQDNRGTDTEMDHTTGTSVTDMRAEHPTAGLVQEHGVIQGEMQAGDTPAANPAAPEPEADKPE